MIHFDPEIPTEELSELISELVIYESELGNTGDLLSLGLEMPIPPSRDTLYRWDDTGTFF